MASEREHQLSRIKEKIFDEIRFLAPDEAQKLLAEMANDMKQVAEKYDRLLQDTLLS